MFTASPVFADGFNDAQPYSAIAFGDFTAANSRVEGRLAAEGDIALQSYSIGDKLSSTLSDVLIAGKDIQFDNGSVKNGNIIAAGSAENVSGSVRNGLADGATIIEDAALPISFSKLKTELSGLSQTLAALPANGSVEFKWGGLYMKAACDQATQVFQPSGAEVLQSHTFSVDISCAPADATYIFNIDGTNTGMTNMGLQSLEAVREQVVYNFYQATELTLQSVGVEGSILALNAAIDAQTRAVNGHVFAKSWNGSVAINHYPFTGNLSEYFQDQDTTPPVITLPDDVTVEATAILTPVEIGSASAVDRVDGELTPVPSTSGPFPLGITEVAWSVQDASGNSTTAIQTITVSDTTAPVLTLPDDLTVTASDAADIDIGSASATDIFAVTITNNAPQEFPIGATYVTWTAADTSGNEAYATQLIKVENEQVQDLPPNPSDIAPTLPNQPIISFEEQVSFLYAGNDPVQTVDDPSVFDDYRVSVIRGKVLDANGKDLPGVKVTIKGFAEYGYTQTRSDGFFDIAVNGGQDYVIEFKHDGLMRSERRLNVDWNEFTPLDSSVVLLPYDTAASTIDLASSTEIQVHTSSPVSDFRGERQAKVFFPAGLSATMTLPDGSESTLQSMTVRATEYTAGVLGFSAMPGSLPASTEYTYAVNLTADEAQTAEATTITFNKPVTWYVDNFLGFPTGDIMPVGYYRFDEARWVPEPNARMMSIIGIDADTGNAIVSFNKDLSAATDDELAEMAVTEAELRKLAQEYPAAATGMVHLWRVQSTHFTPFDCNDPPFTNPQIVPPSIGAGSSNGGSSNGGGGSDGDSPDEADPVDDNPDDNTLPQPEDMSCVAGCVINPETRTLKEHLPVIGTPIDWSFTSANTASNLNTFEDLTVALSKARPKADVIGVTVDVDIAGQQFHYLYSNNDFPMQDLTIDWNGLDAYGRKIETAQATVTVKYHYPVIYVSFPWNSDTSIKRAATFASGEQFPVEQLESNLVNINYQGFSIAQMKQFYDVALYTRSAAKQWTQNLKAIHSHEDQSKIADPWQPSLIHRYNPDNDILYKGNGDILYDASATPYSHTFFNLAGGSGTWGEEGDEADQVVMRPNAAFYSAKGELTIVDSYVDGDGYGHGRIWQVDDDNRLHKLAGTGTWEGDEVTATPGNAKEALLYFIIDAFFNQNNELILLDEASTEFRLMKWTPDGQIRLLAVFPHTEYADPNNKNCPQITEIPVAAHNYCLNDVSSMALQADGNVLIATRNGVIIQASPEGKVRPIFGGYGQIFDMIVLKDQSILIASSDNVVYRLLPSGQLIEFAGNGHYNVSDIGGLATQAGIGEPVALAELNDGSIIIAAQGTVLGKYLLKVNPYGYISAYLGTEDSAIDAPLNEIPNQMSATPEGKILFSFEYTVAALQPNTLARTEDGGYLILDRPSGETLYEFDNVGRHTRTLATKTGIELFRFGYNSNNQLISVIDRDDQITTLSRDADGKVNEIIAPTGQSTKLYYDSDGRLKEFVRPDNSAYQFGYFERNLESITQPNGDTDSYLYDAKGLLQDTWANGGVRRFETKTYRNDEGELARTWQKLTSAEGYITFYRSRATQSGWRVNTTVNAAGKISQSMRSPNGNQIASYSDDQNNRIQQRTMADPDPRYGSINYTTNATSSMTDGEQTLTRTVTTKRSTPINETQGFTPLDLTIRSTVNDTRAVTSEWDADARTQTLTSAEGVISNVQLDTKGRPKTLSRTGLFDTTMRYYDNGNLKSVTQGARTTQYGYDDWGYLNAVTDALNHTTRYQRDIMGRIDYQTLPNGALIDYAYDLNGNLREISLPSGDIHSFTYKAGNVAENYEPPLPNDSATDDPIGDTHPNTVYGFNLDKQLQTVTRPDGDVLTYGHDDTSGELTSITTPDGNYGFAYEHLAGASQLTLDTGVDITTTALGSLITSIAWNADDFGFSNVPSVNYSYNNFFEVQRVTVTDGSGANTDFNIVRNLDAQPTTVGELGLSYENGFLKTTELGSSSTELAYNDYGELESYIARQNSDEQYSFTLIHNDGGQIEQKTETVLGTTTVYDYEYTDLGQLKRVLTDNVETEHYSYDDNGNRTHVNGEEIAEYDTQDRLITYNSNRYRYSANGELSQKTNDSGTTTYKYDVFSNLRKVTLPDGTAVEYLIDAQNRRVGKKINGTLTQAFIYKDQLNPIAELDGGGKLVSSFVYGSKGHVPEYMVKDGKTYRIITDQIGSVRLIVNAENGTVAQQIDYDSFGNITQDTNPGFQPFGFAGGLYDLHTGLVRFGARDYDAEPGRWTTKDPIGFAGGELSLYGYVGGNPVNFIDLLGLDRYVYSRHFEILYYYNTTGFPAARWDAEGTGAWGLGPLPPGIYDISSPVKLPNTPANASYCDGNGNCWWSGLEPQFSTDRGGFGIHTDGGDWEGTLGCVGINGDDTTDLFNHLKEHDGAPLIVY